MRLRDLLIKAWVVFGTIGGILSIASLADAIVEWVAFVQRLILVYRDIVDSFWAPVLAWIGLDPPRWLHDYLTLAGLSATAVLWALHSTAKELSFGALGSTLGVIRSMFFSFQTATSVWDGLKSDFPANESAPRSGPVAIREALVPPDAPKIWVLLDFLWIAVLFLSIVLAPYLVPFVLWFHDREDMGRAGRLFAQVREDLVRRGEDEADKAAFASAFERRVTSFMAFIHIDRIYYSVLLKNQVWYYCGVLVLFLALLVVNEALLRLGVSNAVPDEVFARAV